MQTTRVGFAEIQQGFEPASAPYVTIRVDAAEPELAQAFRSLAEHLPSLMARRRRALQENDIETLLNVLVPDPPADDPSRAIALDNALARDSFLREIPCLTSRQVAELAGHKAKNTAVTASRWKQAGKLFSVPRAGEELYPAFQFRDGVPNPAITAILAALPAHKSAWQIAFWFTSGNGWLDGATPADGLADVAAVIAAAHHEAEGITG